MVETNKNTSTVDPGIKPAEYVEFIEVVETDEIQIPIDEAFAAAGVLNEGLNHALLNNRDLADQHPIEAITELRDELDEIERLKTVYSNMAGFANYYKWNNGAYDEYGYFVSLAPHTSFIEICNGQDIFGVTVPHAAFIGNQDQSAPRDNTYALVVTSGFVEVRCEADVAEGDYVVSNSVGVAEKTASQSGYKVIAIDNSTGVNYATIALGVQACTTDLLDKNTQKLDERVEKVETNVIAAMNAANAAHNMAQNVTNSNNVMSGQVSDALAKVESMEQQVEDLGSQVGNVSTTVTQTQAIAQNASTSAEASRLAAEKTANESLASVNALIDTLEPITTWDDPTGTRGAEYLTTYIKDGVATKVEVQTVEKLTEENKSAIEESAEFFSRTLSSVDKYSVGEYSQSYGLTYEQAKSILTEGMVYIPTKNFYSCCDQHKNVPTHCEIFSDIEDANKARNKFTPEYHYIWSKNESDELDWVEGIGRVAFFANEVPGQSGNLKYWYIDSNTAPEGYEPYALYIWEDDQWIKVNILAGNANNRVTSMIKQTAEEVSAEVVNARGTYAGLGARIEADNKAYAQMVASVVNDDGTVNTASIINSVNDSGSQVVLNGDHIVLNGATTNGNGTFQIHEDGYMIATGGNIGKFIIYDDSITSNMYKRDDNGAIVPLTDETSKLQRVLVSPGTESEYTVGDNITGNNWSFLAGTGFGVKNTGEMYAVNGKIGGCIFSLPREVTLAEENEEGVYVSGDIEVVESEQIGPRFNNLVKLHGPGFPGSYYSCWLEYALKMYIKCYPNDTYSMKTFFYRKYTEGDVSLWTRSGDIPTGYYITTLDPSRVTYEYGTSSSMSDIPKNWSNPADFDTGLFSDYSFFWVKVSTYIGEQYAGDLYYCLGNLSSSASIFQFDDGLSFTKNSINQDGTSIIFEGGQGQLIGTWKYNSSSISTSWRGAKHDIENIDDRYSVLFDNLLPVRYKYNDGQSNRYHTGFILDELKIAMDKAGIDTSELAAYCVADEVTGEGGIRYDELIALCVDQIQTLKSQVAELKETVVQLETLVKEKQ